MDERNESDGPGLGRPYLSRAGRSIPWRARPGDALPRPTDLSAGASPAGARVVRPYLVSGGRTRPDVDIPLEALVKRRPGAFPDRAATPDQQALAARCTLPVSLVELAAAQNLPLGVVRVLVGDLVSADILSLHQTGERLSRDVDFLKRLIHGVRAL